MKASLRLALAAALALAVHLPAHADTVDVALVLAVDVSESVTDDEYRIQRDGIAEAFDDPVLASTVAGGAHHAIEVLVMEWSDPGPAQVTVDWTRVSDAESARAFAARVRETTRRSHGRTAIGGALLAAETALKRAPDPAVRKVVDVSGDGMTNVGPSTAGARDALVSAGVTVNGLVMLNEEPWVDGYYNENVIGGPGAFLMQVQDYRGFAAAIRQKLLAELVALSQQPAAPPT